MMGVQGLVIPGNPELGLGWYTRGAGFAVPFLFDGAAEVAVRLLELLNSVSSMRGWLVASYQVREELADRVAFTGAWSGDADSPLDAAEEACRQIERRLSGSLHPPESMFLARIVVGSDPDASTYTAEFNHDGELVAGPKLGDEP